MQIGDDTQNDPIKGRSFAVTVPRVVLVLGVLVFTKNAYTSSLSSFYTFYIIERFGLTAQQSQLMLFVFLGGMAAGVMLGGPIGDRIGPLAVIWASILGALPFTLALPYAGLWGSVALTAAIGFVIASAFPAIVVFAQELMPGRVGFINGVFFGLAFGLGGLAAAVLGVLADARGIEFVYRVCAWLPALAQLPVPYFNKQLADFRAGTRTGVKPLVHHDFNAAATDYTYYVRFMRAAASGVSASDAETVGNYYAAQARAKVPAPNVSPEVLARGKSIATNGAWDRQVPPCFKCHATNGMGVSPSFPPIAGQHAAYTARQLMAWKHGDRTNDPQKLMAFTAQQLTDEEIQAVAAYLATLELPSRKAAQ